MFLSRNLGSQPRNLLVVIEISDLKAVHGGSSKWRPFLFLTAVIIVFRLTDLKVMSSAKTDVKVRVFV